MSPQVMEAAQAYAALGWVPTPIHSCGPDMATCSCPKGARCGNSAGKHPIGTAWQKLETPEQGIAELGALHRKRRRTNVGILTGKPSGFFVLDVDKDKGGFDSMKRLVSEHGRMPRTLIVETGSGGFHYYFSMPDFDVTNRDALGKAGYPGIDIRGTGGQVVAPPSVSWAGPYSVRQEAQVAQAPGWLLEILRPAESTTAAKGPTPAVERTVVQTPQQAAYENAIIKGELARLQELPQKGWTVGWDTTTFEAGCQLVELANALWSSLDLDEAHAAFINSCPPEEPGYEPEAKWTSALAKVGQKARPAPEPRPDVLYGDEAKPAASGQSSKAIVGTVETRAEVQLRSAGQLSDAEQVARFAGARLVGRFAYAPRLGWLRWDGRRWGECDESVILEQGRRYAKDLVIAATERGADADAIKAMTALLSAGRIAALAKLARGIDGVAISLHDLDAQPDLLNVANGVVDLRTGELLPHDPQFLLTKVSPVNFTPGASHEDWAAAQEAMPAETRTWMQARFGQAATGYPVSDDIAPVCFGGGSNGKSSVIEAVMSALGDHAGLVSERLLQTRLGDHATELMQLRGLRLAFSEEMPQGNTLDTKRLKDIVGTPRITARAIRKDNVSWTPTHSLILSSNFMPKVADTDHGTWRRLALVVFPWRFMAHPTQPGDRTADPGLRQRLKEGQSGQHEAVLAWIVEGARRWYGHGRVLPPAPARIDEDTLGWRRESDLVLAYMQDRLTVDPDAMVPSTELFADFGDWLTGRGHYRWSDRTFKERFDRHEAVAGRGVTRARTTSREGLSRRSELAHQEYAPGQQVSVFRGLRFKESS